MPTLVKNQKAGFDYEFLEKFEAGLRLRGFEVKSLRLGRAEIRGARVIVRGNEAFLVGATIHPYQAGNLPKDYDPQRVIKLLLSKKELARLAGSSAQKGLTIIPISVYTKGGKLKLEFALARGKKKYDKRQVLKKREAKRQIERTLKNKAWG